jgi:hypothetical protein
MISHRVNGEEPLPTCNGGLSNDFYFPNDCVSECMALEQEMDFDTSRDVNGVTKCYCSNNVGVCNDEPTCEDLLIIPGQALVGCSAYCPDSNDVTAVDDVQFTDDPSAGNKNQTHFMVACTCDGVTQCGTDFVLFSDLTFLPSCTSGAEGPTLDLNNEEDCTTYCLNVGFTSATYESGACSCTNDAGTATACDDAKANDDRGEFTDCFEEVGVSTADCPTPAPTEIPGGGSSGGGGSSAATTVIMAVSSMAVSVLSISLMMI